MRHIYWLTLLGSIILLLYVDIKYYVYPLQQTLHHKARVLTQLKTQSTQPKIPLNTSAISPPDVFYIPYLSHVWLDALTKKIALLALSINKLERQHTASTTDITRWDMSLSGNVRSLFLFFDILYRDFPWLSIEQPRFISNNQLITVSFTLLALNNQPTTTKYIAPMQKHIGSTLPFCLSPDHFSRQTKPPDNQAIAGIIRQGNQKTILKRLDDQQVSTVIITMDPADKPRDDGLEITDS